MVGGSKALGIHLKYGEPSASGAACTQIRADLVHPSLVFVPHIAPTTEPVARLVCNSAPIRRTPPTFSWPIGSPNYGASGAACMQFRADPGAPFLRYRAT